MSQSPMECSEIRDVLLAGGTPSGAAVDSHLRQCATCSELLRDDGRLARALTKSEAPNVVNAPLWSSLESALAAESGVRAWLRGRSTPFRLFLAALAASVVVWFGGRPADPSVAPIRPFPWLVLFGLIGLVCLWVFVAPLGRPRPARGIRSTLVAIALLLPFGYAWASLGADADAGSFIERAFGCFVYGALLAIPFCAVVWTLDRSDRPWPTWLAGLGAVAGLVANAALSLHCANADPAHLVAGHATIGSAFAMFGILWSFGRRSTSR